MAPVTANHPHEITRSSGEAKATEPRRVGNVTRTSDFGSPGWLAVAVFEGFAIRRRGEVLRVVSVL